MVQIFTFSFNYKWLVCDRVVNRFRRHVYWWTLENFKYQSESRKRTTPDSKTHRLFESQNDYGDPDSGVRLIVPKSYTVFVQSSPLHFRSQIAKFFYFLVNNLQYCGSTSSVFYLTWGASVVRGRGSRRRLQFRPRRVRVTRTTWEKWHVLPLSPTSLWLSSFSHYETAGLDRVTGSQWGPRTFEPRVWPSGREGPTFLLREQKCKGVYY